MIEQNYIIIATALTIGAYTLMLWVLSKKYYKLKREFKNNLDHARRLPIPEPEKYTIIDLIYEQKFTPDELLSLNMKEEHLIEELKKEAGKHFVKELDKLNAIQLDKIREPYHYTPNHYRFITKIALKDE